MKFFYIKAPNQKKFIQEVFVHSQGESRKHYFHLNANNINIALGDKSYFNILNSSEAEVFLEGMGAVYAARLKGLPIPGKISFTGMILHLLNHPDYLIQRPGIFFLGSKPGVVNSAQKNLKNQFPYANFAGRHHGYFKYDTDIIQQINNSGTKILFVGMGCPLQEKWIHKNRNRLNVPVVISCGGKFDYYATNRIRRAPPWMRKNGMEWVYRFLLEPHRLWRRYTIELIQFFLNFTRYSFKIKEQRPDAPR